jgi:hypothetical protein
MTDQLQKDLETVAHRSLGPSYNVKLRVGKKEKFDSVEFVLTKS